MAVGNCAGTEEYYLVAVSSYRDGANPLTAEATTTQFPRIASEPGSILLEVADSDSDRSEILAGFALSMPYDYAVASDPRNAGRGPSIYLWREDEALWSEQGVQQTSIRTSTRLITSTFDQLPTGSTDVIVYMEDKVSPPPPAPSTPHHPPPSPAAPPPLAPKVPQPPPPPFVAEEAGLSMVVMGGIAGAGFLLLVCCGLFCVRRRRRAQVRVSHTRGQLVLLGAAESNAGRFIPVGMSLFTLSLYGP
jgi:hypothetical protein